MLIGITLELEDGQKARIQFACLRGGASPSSPRHELSMTAELHEDFFVMR